jgi:hypothetical protein
VKLNEGSVRRGDVGEEGQRKECLSVDSDNVGVQKPLDLCATNSQIKRGRESGKKATVRQAGVVFFASSQAGPQMLLVVAMGEG